MEEKIAEEDIKVRKYYAKVVLEEFSVLVSPFMHHSVKEGERYTSENFGEVREYEGVWGGGKVQNIDNGFHSYERDSLISRETYKRFYHADPFECTIPKGTPYYYNPSHHEYVSRDIVIGTEIKQEIDVTLFDKV